MTTRLDTKYPELARAIEMASPGELQVLTTTAARFALRNDLFDEATYGKVLAAIEHHRALPLDVAVAIVDLQEGWEAKYSEALASTDRPLDASAMQWFHRARSVDAIIAAGDLSEVDAADAADVAHEALASQTDEGPLVAALWQALGGPSSEDVQ